MNTSMPTDDVAVAFRRSYEVVVDQVRLPPDQFPAYRLSQPRRPRWAWGLASVAGVLLVAAIALVGGDGSPADTEVAERVALVDVPSELGGEPTVVNSSVSTDGFDPTPPIDMWHWKSGDGPTEWVVLLETAPGSDVSNVLGPTEAGVSLVPPEEAEVGSATLPDAGWHARHWVDSGRWRIALGYDEESVVGLAAAAVNELPSELEMSGFELVYQGPQVFLPLPEVELSELFYTSPAGGFSLHLANGWSEGTVATALRSQNVELTEVNGADAVIAGDEINWWITWAVDEHSTAVVQSSDLKPDLLLAIAEGVEPVSLESWAAIADSASPPTDADSAPTAASFIGVGEPTVLVSGEDWAVKSQAVTTTDDSAEPGKLGLCGWVEIDGRVAIDFGCSIRQPGQRLPVRVSTPDGSVVVGELRTEVAEVRFEGSDVVVPVRQIHPDIPFGWFAVREPSGVALSEYTFWSSEGEQLPIDPRLGDQLSGRVHSIN